MGTNMTYFDPFSFSSAREALTALFDRLPCGEDLAAAALVAALKDPRLIESLQLSPAEIQAVRNWMWAQGMD